MSKEETVEISIRIPKKLHQLLEDENYLGWNREYFFEAAVRSLIGAQIGDMAYDKAERFYEKYGKDVGVIYPPNC